MLRPASPDQRLIDIALVEVLELADAERLALLATLTGRATVDALVDLLYQLGILQPALTDGPEFDDE